MTDFIDDGTSLPFPKVQWDGVSNEIVQPTQWCRPVDWNTVCSGLVSARTAILRGVVNVKHYGAVGDGTTDDTAALQAAISDTQGRTLYIPKGTGPYKFTSTLTISSTGHRIVGDVGIGASNGGTELAYYGTGVAVQIGSEDLVNSPNWASNWYGGPQDQMFENISITHGAPDATLASAPGAGNVYKSGSYGIWDWYGGKIILRDVRLSHFEANFSGIQSDVNLFVNVDSHYSKYGLYLGPRSDQQVILGMYSFLCDRAVTVDRARRTVISGARFVGCGHATASAVEIRRGSAGVVVSQPWLEHLGGVGYAGTDQQSFISAGEVDGYGAGGTIQSAGGTPTTAAAQGLKVDDPHILTELTGVAGHTQYVVSVDKCQSVSLEDPTVPSGSSITNLDSLVAVQATHTPSASDCQVWIRGTGLSNTLTKNFLNLGGGSPLYRISGVTSGGSFVEWSSSGVYEFRAGATATAGADALQLSQSGVAGAVMFTAPNFGSGQQVRFDLRRALQSGSSSAAPSSGTWQQGDAVRITDPSDSNNFAFWFCVTGGTSGTWRKGGLLLNSTNGLTLSANPSAVCFEGIGGGSGNTSSASTGAVRGRQQGSFDTTSGALNAIGVLAQSVATRSAGSNNLTNIALRATATSGQDNRAIETQSGDVRLNTTDGITFFGTAVVGAGTRAAAPSTGTHVAGEVVFNGDPIAGGTVGWVCVTGGSPGTWKSFGTVDPSASLTGSRGGDFGDGNLGTAAFDGSTAVTGCTRSGSVYTATKDLAFTTATFSSGVTLDLSGGTAGFELMCSVSLVGPGSGTATIKCDGNSASGATGGAALTTSSPISSTSGLGATGLQNAGQAGGASSTWQTSFKAGNGGNGGASATNAGATGGTVGTTLTDAQASMICWDDMRRARILTGTILGGGGGGASGGGTTGVASGGGGGGGGAWCRIAARLITNGAQFVFSANGGSGAAGTGGNAGGGGGGGGGYCIVAHGGATTPTGLVINTNVLAQGGAGGAAAGTGSAGSAGTAGQVRIFSLGVS